MKSKIYEYLLKLNNKAMGKKSKFNSLKSLMYISIALMVLTSACAQTGNKSKAQADNTVKAKTIIGKPEMNIQMAVISGNLEVVKQHIEAGTDLNEKDAMSGSTPLITAASFGKIDISKALIDAGADLSLTNNDGSDALHVAAFFCHIEIVQMLIDANADKTTKNNFGATARETVMGPFGEVKPIYEMLQQQLGPLGLQIDLAEIEKTRPVIAMMLQ
ncbi:ankyrin repeat domain-containing protein [Maribacter polysiphoniae]|uniref:Ankyrin repeat protein n=2 Tax=Maribacter polysiphoniae TaxID=429344 RepID=A0A316E5Y0_9FLAO|nr:ankyrin repeat domain-containing protein [Maribacter polysiphoniae]PWK26107.1 ankyrin repeat protein [Maribacter polysiphoniae]